MWSDKSGESVGLIPGRRTFGPLFLMTITPVVAILITHVFVRHEGSVRSFLDANEALEDIFPDPFHPVAWKAIGAFMVTQLLLMRLVPGKPVYGPITQSGHIPEYKSNGFKSFLITMGLFLLGAYYFELYNGGIAYDYLPEIISGLNVFSFVLCILIYIKGAFLWPTSDDYGTTGNPIFDFYWGVELYPRLFGWDIKQFTNCRVGCMYWGLGVLSYACKQYELYGSMSDSMLVSASLQLIFIAKFFWWEDGYMRSIDIMHDHAGYYLCWGCLVWVPSVYTSPVMYLVTNPIHLGTPLAVTIFVASTTLIFINYAADHQRMYFRECEGKCTIWGKPAEYIVATYETDKGEKKESLLLACGWWGIARHFHYVPEILASLCWTLPAGFDSPAPYFYVAYLTVLLLDRAYRDDARCSDKYKKDWAKYCERVPSLVIPGVL